MLFHFILEYNITLIFSSSTAAIMEPDDGETALVEYCFQIVNNGRQVSDAVFDINISPSSNASRADFYLNTSNPLVIEAGQTEGCVEFVVIGDDLIEGPEVVLVSVDARSEFDRVLLRPSRFLVLNIADNIGKPFCFMLHDSLSWCFSIGFL